VADLGKKPGGHVSPLFWVKKEEMMEVRKAGRESKTTPTPPPPPSPSKLKVWICLCTLTS